MSPENINIIPTPFSKTSPVELTQDTGKGESYPFLQRYLGSLIGYLLADKLKSPMKNFLSYLVNIDPRALNIVFNKIEGVKEKFQTLIDKTTGVFYNQCLWIHQPSFMPTSRQERAIANLPQDSEINQIAAANGFANVALLLREMILNHDFQITVGEKKLSAKEIFKIGAPKIRKNEKLENNNQPDFLNLKVENKLCQLLTYALGYYYFDFSGTSADVDRYEKNIALMSARPDMLGFWADPQDKEAQTLIKKLPKIFAHYLLNPAALTTVSRGEIDNVNQLISFLELGRVKMIFVEIKSQTTTHQRKNGRWLPVRFEKDKIPDHHLDNIAHSVIAMFEFFTRVTNLPGRQIDGHQTLINLMDPDIEQRRQALFQSRELIRKIMPNCYFLLARVYWPIINPTQKKYRGLIINQAPPPEIDVKKIELFTLMRVMIGRTRKVFEKMSLQSSDP